VAGLICLAITLGYTASSVPAHAADTAKPLNNPVISSEEELLQDFKKTPMPSASGVDRKLRALSATAFAEGQRLSQSGKFQEALVHYFEAAEADPSYSPITAQIALTLLRLDRKEEAINLLTRQVRLQPEASRLHSLLAFCLFDPKDPAKYSLALKHARIALKQDPTLISNYRILAQGADIKKNPAKLRELLNQARETPSNEAAFYIRMAETWTRILMESNTPPSSISLQVLPFYEKALQAEPSNPEYAFQLGQVHFDAGNYPQALQHYESAYARNRKISGLRERLALSYMSCGRESEAIVVLEDLLEEFPERKNLYTSIGELYERAGKWQEACAYYERYISIHDPNAEDYIRLAQAQMMLKKPEAALTTMEAAEKNFPSMTPILLLKSITLHSLKRFDEALTLLTNIEKLARGDEKILNTFFYFRYGATYEEAGRFAEAEKMLRKSIDLDPRHHQALNYLGYMFAEENRNLKEAEKLISTALALSPDNPGYQDSLGWVYHRQGRYEQAKTLFLKALAKVPDNPEILEHLGHAHYQLGETQEALLTWRQAMRHSENPDKLQAHIHQITGNRVEMKSNP